MFKDFVNDLRTALQELDVENIKLIIDEFTARYNALINGGKSEFESVLALGDPQVIAHEYAGKVYSATTQIDTHLELSIEGNDEKSEFIDKANIENTDKDKPITTGELIFYIPFLVLSAFGIIAAAFIGGLSFYAGCAYLYFAWVKFSAITSQVIVFFLAIIGIILAIGIFYMTFILVKKLVAFIKNLVASYKKRK